MKKYPFSHRKITNRITEHKRSKLIGIPSTSLNIHKDQYIETDFDLVTTSLANAFFQTNLETGLYNHGSRSKK
ncbi:MAG: hypothetical protein EWV85_08760 [Microcystis aeruginosa Ma_QC_C_20070703_M131]|uniref:Uncharacterized protein n=1 Tax=Microcystis aeruginosa Ma_QC_C_20070703_M131 TaxID=2486263 RepID=A0A551Y4B1_MICAE|nr:MAG: hypothetical protein EWV85_08760 [Microcystis aeruginosa Ma_QC_C_20070703_M131]